MRRIAQLRGRHLGALVASLLLVIPVGAAGQGLNIGSGSGQPIEILARDGIEWHRETQRYIARGEAKATQGDTVVESDVLTAFYRQPKNGSGTEIFRYQADGNVRISTPTHRAVGDRAIYDVDSGVLVLTGASLKLTTPAEVITARDALEYWTARQVAVARGDALVATQDGHRMKADLLSAHFEQGPANGADGPVATNRPGRNPARGAPAASAQGTESRRLQRIEGFGAVHVSTPTEIAVGDRGVYNAKTGIAVLAGNVRITRGENQLNGDYAEVNTNSGISRLLSRPDQGGDTRVRGLFVPEDKKSDKAPSSSPKTSRQR